MTKEIGRIIHSIIFSDEEKNRLSNLILDEKSLPATILTTKINSIKNPSFWKSAFKHFRVTGFRPSSPDAKKMVLKRAIEGLKKNPGEKNNDIWLLYKRCVVEYVGHELSNLNKLLIHEKIEESKDKVTENIFKAIIRNAPLYQVTNEEIYQLYDIWGFDRLDTFDSLFKSDSIDINVLNRLIEKRSDEILNSINTKIIEIKSDLNKRIEINTENTNTLIQKINKLEEVLNHSIVLVKKEMNSYISEVSASKLNSINERISELNNRISINQNAAHKTIETITSNLHPQVADILKRIKELENNTKDVSIKEMQKKVEVTTQKMPISELLPKWKESLNLLGLKDVAIGTMLTIITLFRNCNLFIVDRPEIPISLFKQTPNTTIFDIVASPTWLLESDWNDKISLIDQCINPLKVIIIRDFDVGIQETYLIPTLIRWINDSESEIKILLVPSRIDSTQITTRILDLSRIVSFDSSTISKLTKFGSQLSEHINSFSLLKETLPETLKKKTRINKNDGESDIQKILPQYKLPVDLLLNFENLQREFNELSKGSTNPDLSSHFTLYPWLSAVKGELAKRILEERFKTMFDFSSYVNKDKADE